MRVPRWAHRTWAALSRNPWLRCPECGAGFGAHERLLRGEDRGGHITTILLGGTHHSICPACTRLGVGCRSHFEHRRVHAQCPYLTGRDRPG